MQTSPIARLFRNTVGLTVELQAAVLLGPQAPSAMTAPLAFTNITKVSLWMSDERTTSRGTAVLFPKAETTSQTVSVWSGLCSAYSASLLYRSGNHRANPLKLVRNEGTRVSTNRRAVFLSELHIYAYTPFHLPIYSSIRLCEYTCLATKLLL
jgi:hypothetical protein